MSAWTNVPKPSLATITTFIGGGEPIGMLLALTTSGTPVISSVSSWTNLNKPTTASWVSLAKPTTGAWSAVSKPSSASWTAVSKPISSTWTIVNKPTT